ncbi:hypothetical protein Taro_055124 [Colocasia esculenta]|uniref:Uncharacterized protein n=1 Tax=Colocasia esculenta TaxID=4460 RepID=A0A843XS03_COLES|nr:hypothetical protein [Colocasia esculenta]
MGLHTRTVFEEG